MPSEEGLSAGHLLFAFLDEVAEILGAGDGLGALALAAGALPVGGAEGVEDVREEVLADRPGRVGPDLQPGRSTGREVEGQNLGLTRRELAAVQVDEVDAVETLEISL